MHSCRRNVEGWRKCTASHYVQYLDFHRAGPYYREKAPQACRRTSAALSAGLTVASGLSFGCFALVDFQTH